ncbi:MAG: peptide chain release factor N(5)-glutamine methyltransferase [Desulfobacterales bacterium]|jgi:release factor glutamine methyltransferase|nr:peptide chain release factor N(5)-glutamine methyltransferase [Desulfobacteraceae bacterium]MBT4362984.1 peptide chain release factor N(5)-glutamine methyltransferase [Desulfobacteraceae bacterium]MBT7086397.1 peptide chain release factor N(5)-glutamine methyltransferase [Desulfobacterales bacterium]MBT7695858.1 peptide chain release factor N(5)-glutamine methyltransferase [Desulfobacterales bacterium]
MQKPTSHFNSDWTILKILEWTTSFFKSYDIDSSRVTAEILLAYVLKIERIDLYLQYDQPLNRDELEMFKELIKRRAGREPVEYIVGSRGFWSLDMTVTNDVLIPRQDTETLVEEALSFIPEEKKEVPRRILDLGTGSGAIILALASERSGNVFFASDRSYTAIKQARYNQRVNSIEDTIHFFSGNWFETLNENSQKFDMIVSNPPYIRSGDIKKLQPEIVFHEPLIALDGGEDGFCEIRNIIYSAYKFLKKNGYLLLEIGHDQKDGVQEMIDSCGCYEKIVFTKDYAGCWRVVRMMKKEKK